MKISPKQYNADLFSIICLGGLELVDLWISTHSKSNYWTAKEQDKSCFTSHHAMASTVALILTFWLPSGSSARTQDTYSCMACSALMSSSCFHADLWTVSTLLDFKVFFFFAPKKLMLLDTKWIYIYINLLSSRFYPKTYSYGKPQAICHKSHPFS